MYLIINSGSVPIIQSGVVNCFLIGLSTITLDSYYLMLSEHQVQEKTYQLIIMVQYFVNVHITVSFFVGD